jgi:hypothetical protein
MRYAFLVLMLVGAAGCGEPAVAPVSGRVTLDEKPLPNATVIFMSAGQEESPNAGSSGKTDSKGQYVLHRITKDMKGAFVGKHKVSITVGSGKKGAANADKKGLVPAKYNTASELTFTVPREGTSNADFHLKSE